MKKNTSILWLFLLLLIFVCAGFLYNNLNKKTSNGEITSEKTIKVSNSNFPDFKKVTEEIFVDDFELTDRDSNKVKLSDFYGQTIVLNFWASWCPPCKAEMPDFEKMNTDFESGDDIVLLTINLTDGQRETKEKAEKFLETNNYTFRALFDTEGKVGTYFGIQSIPSTFIIDKEGRLFSYTFGQTIEEKVIYSVNEAMEARK